MVGGGQLARMTHQAAIALGQTLRVLATAPDDPAAQVTPDVIIGSHTDLQDLRRAAAGAAVLTFDHEHVPTELLEKLVADGVNVAPPPHALVHAQDKLVMRRRLEALGVPVPRYVGIPGPESLGPLDAFAQGENGPVVVKAVRGGYDGRGVWIAGDAAHAREIAQGYLASGVPVLVEDPDLAPASVMMTPAPAANSLPGGRPAPVVGPTEARIAAAAPAPSSGGFRNLFRNVTGGGLMRRTLPEPTPAPVADRLVPDSPAPRQATRAPQQDDMGLDIPTFLRRQSN
jgi:hypothetical protein